MSIAVTISGDSETGAKLVALGATLKRPAGLLKVLEREGRNRLVRHFRARNTVPNKLGGRRTNYWQRIADSVTTSLSGLTVTFSVTDPTFRQKVEGGRIVPKKAKALAIPVNPKAYGVAPRVLERQLGIKLFVIKSGFLAAAIAGQSDSLEVFYLLSKGVNQAKDPAALPPADEFKAGLVERATTYVERLSANPKNLA